MRTDLHKLREVVWVNPDQLSGAPCFKGTRIPVQMLVDHLAAGFSLDEFLETVRHWIVPRHSAFSDWPASR